MYSSIVCDTDHTQVPTPMYSTQVTRREYDIALAVVCRRSSGAHHGMRTRRAELDVIAADDTGHSVVRLITGAGAMASIWARQLITAEHAARPAGVADVLAPRLEVSRAASRNYMRLAEHVRAHEAIAPGL